MKRNLTLLLASLLLVFTLTACGRGDKQNNSGQNDNTITDNGSSGTTGAGENGIQDNGTTDNNADNDDSLIGDMGDAVKDGIDDIGDGIADAGDAITGNDANRTEGTTNKTGSMPGGVTYGQMLRNARVRDTNGNLMDGENAVTSSKSY